MAHNMATWRFLVQGPCLLTGADGGVQAYDVGRKPRLSEDFQNKARGRSCVERSYPKSAKTYGVSMVGISVMDFGRCLVFELRP